MSYHYYYRDRYDRYDFYQRENPHADLVCQLDSMRDKMCGIGTRKLKNFLNRKVKEGDDVAMLYRQAIQIEDVNISAKKYHNYSDDYYAEKSKLIEKLLDLCASRSDVKYGYQDNAEDFPAHIVYFELPGCEQISFHCDLDHPSSVPHYDGKWDDQTNSTLPKLEVAILKLYGEEIEEINQKYK